MNIEKQNKVDLTGSSLVCLPFSLSTEEIFNG